MIQRINDMRLFATTLIVLAVSSSQAGAQTRIDKPPVIKFSQADLDKLREKDDLRLRGIQKFFLMPIVETNKYTIGELDSPSVSKTAKAFLERYKIPYTDKPAPGIPTLSLFISFTDYDNRDGKIVRVRLSVSEDARLVRDPKATIPAISWEASENLSTNSKNFAEEAQKKFRHVLERFCLAYLSANR